MTKVYIEHMFKEGPNKGTREYIGPFPSWTLAFRHRKAWGPDDGELGDFPMGLKPTLLTWVTIPQDHIKQQLVHSGGDVAG